MNEKMLDFAHYILILCKYKQAKLTKNNGLDSSIVYRIEWPWTKGPATHLIFA